MFDDVGTDGFPFGSITGQAIPHNPDRWNVAGPAECQVFCQGVSDCQGFDYNLITEQCQLNKQLINAPTPGYVVGPKYPWWIIFALDFQFRRKFISGHCKIRSSYWIELNLLAYLIKNVSLAAKKQLLWVKKCTLRTAFKEYYTANGQRTSMSKYDEMRRRRVNNSINVKAIFTWFFFQL